MSVTSAAAAWSSPSIAEAIGRLVFLSAAIVSWCVVYVSPAGLPVGEGAGDAGRTS